MENKRKHLEMIQAVINRMANTSFLLKGWSITVVAALFALSSKEGSASVLIMAIFLSSIFWFLDSYFLRQERMYRGLYEDVRKRREEEIDFSMNASGFATGHTWYRAVFSATLCPFYLGVLITLVIFLVKAMRGADVPADFL